MFTVAETALNTLAGANLKLKCRVKIDFGTCRAEVSIRSRFPKPAATFLTFWLVLGGTAASSQSTTILVGSGSTIPAPLYARWSEEYGKRSSGNRMRYLPVGTVEGIEEISRNVGDFAAGEVQLTQAQQKIGLIALPAILIGIVPVYNVPGLAQPLRFSGEVLARIYLGEIRNWNAPEIASLNPGLTLPNLKIRTVIRTAGKGSNYVFTDFLSKTSPEFRDKIGVTASPKWPQGDPAARSSDMAEKVKNIPGSIGYVEYEYAVKHNLAQGTVLNAAGKFARVSEQALMAACASADSPLWTNFSVSLTNSAGAESYPITSFSWIYLRVPAQSGEREPALRDLLSWIYTKGQVFAAQEGYTTLPPEMLAAIRKQIEAFR